MIEFILSSLRSGFRSRSFQIVALLAVLLVGIAYLAASFSPRQPRTVALDFGFSAVRLSLVLLNLLWVQELLVKEIDQKTVIFSLSYPVPRSAFLLGRFFGVLLLSGLAILVLGLALLLAVMAVGIEYDQFFQPDLGLAYWLTFLGIWLDASVVAAIAVAVATLSTVQMMPFVVGATAAIGGRALGPAMDYLAQGAYGEKELVATYQPLLRWVQWVLPDLSRLDWRYAALYARPLSPELLWSSSAMALGYCALMLALGVWLFSRREIF